MKYGNDFFETIKADAYNVLWSSDEFLYGHHISKIDALILQTLTCNPENNGFNKNLQYKL